MKSALWRMAALSAAGSAMAAGHTFTITDIAGRGWAPDVVTYSVSLKPQAAGRLHLRDEQGRSVPIQVESVAHDRALLCFVTDLPALGSRTFTLEWGEQGAQTGSTLALGQDGDALVVANSLCAVKTPAPAEKSFKPATPASSLPAPVLGFRSGGHAAPWLGAGRILTERPVSAMRVSVTARGPVYAEVCYELQFEGGGYYRAVVRVADRVPMARITEEYDLGRMAGSGQVESLNPAHDWRAGPGGRPIEKDLWELDLTRGWEPDTVEKAVAWGNGGGGDAGTYLPLAEFKPSFLMNAGAYGPDRISVFGLFRAADTNAGPDYPGVGVTPLHNGFWRRAMNLELARPAPDKVVLRLPMTRTPPRWVETSPFCVASHEPALPCTYARRQWGLVLGAPPLPIMAKYGKTPACRTYQARLTYGTVSLDRFKDYILDWPSGSAQGEPDSKPQYPRVFVKARDIPKYKSALTPDNPLTAPMTNRLYSLSRSADLWKAQAVDHLVLRLRNLALSALGFAAQSHHAACDAGDNMLAADDALGFPGLTPEQRRAIRAQVALLAYLFTEPDINGQGSGSHTGNPNMSLARQGWVSAAIAMLPDHPMYEKWRDYMAEWTAFKFADNMAPGGGWFEPGTYHEWGYQRMIWSLLGLEAMTVTDLARIRAYHLADSDFYMNLLTPLDPRWQARMIPGFGNNATHYTSMWLDAAAAAEAGNAELASHLMWAWHANGAQVSDAVLGLARPWLQPKEPKLASRCFPGFGVVFRAHQGPDETYMFLRSGFLWSHWTVDQGNFALYSKGAVLVPPQPYTYFSSKFPDHSQENDIRFGHPANEYRFAWPDSNVLDYRFGARVQYAWASAGYPAWYITPGVTEGFGEGPKLQPGLEQKEGEFWWNRQVVFIVGASPKSPNYFVFHDTVRGEGRLAQWFNLDLLGRKSDVKVSGNRMEVKTEWPIALDIAFADQRALDPAMTEEDQGLNVLAHIYGKTWAALAKDKPPSRNWIRSDGKAVDPATLAVPDVEHHVLVRIPAPAGSDHFWIAYPRGQTETEPALERLGPHAVKVTHSEGTDFVLLAPDHGRFEGEDVVLEGQAAVVRVAPEEVTFALLGGAGRVGYKGQVFEGATGFERTVKVAELKLGVQTIGPDKAEALPCPPLLIGRQEAAPGVTRAVDGEHREYVVDAPAPVVYRDGDVRIEARKALVTRGPGWTRFAAPEGTFVQLAAGKSAVRGLGPFDLTVTATNVSGAVAGRMRTLVVSKPEAIVRPMYEMDKVRWYAGYPDDPAPYRDRPEPQFSMAFGITDGLHKIEIREWESPAMPPEPARFSLDPPKP